MGTGLYFEDLEVGQQFLSPRRTITETDIVMFAALSGDYNPLHTDEVFCQEETPFGTRIAHGLLTVSAVTGLISRIGYADGTVLAFLGMKWNFREAVKAGDTIYARITIIDKRETKKTDRGIFTQTLEIINQRGELVQEGEMILLSRRRPIAVSDRE